MTAPGSAMPQDRPPPHNEEAEQALLGALLTNNRALDKVSGFLRPEHFHDPLHQRIYAAIVEHVEAGRTANAITLRQFFEDDANPNEDGPAYLAELVAQVVTVGSAADYGRIIHDMFMRRQLIELAADIDRDARRHELDVPAADQIARAEADLAALADISRNGDTRSSGPAPLDAALDEAVEAIALAQGCVDGVSGVPTGLVDLNRKTGGLQRGDLIIIAARPSMGKTALALNIATNAADAGYFTAFDSLEMKRAALAQRLIARRSGVPVPAQRRPLTVAQRVAVEEAAAGLRGLRLMIDDGAASASQIRARARAQKRKSGLDLLMIDYLGLIEPADERAPKVYQIEQTTRALKATAKELDIPVVLLVQLSRAVEQREDKRPTLADLRDSGAIEQDADVVMFVYREQYYLERAEPTRRPDEDQSKFNDRYAAWQQRCGEVHNMADIIIAKQRQGEIGTVRLYFDGARQEFSDLQRGAEL